MNVEPILKLGKKKRGKGHRRMPGVVVEAVIARSGGRCEGQVADVCTGRAQHLHHRVRRSQGGPHTVENIVHLCEACHTWAHGNVTEARVLGLISSRPSGLVGRREDNR